MAAEKTNRKALLSPTTEIKQIRLQASDRSMYNPDKHKMICGVMQAEST